MIINNFYDQIIDHANTNKEEEVCGLILLSNDLIPYIERVKNENPNPKESFSISPLKFIDYKLNNKILGVYHSHTAATERPSKQDKAAAEETGLPYLIYSLKTKKFFLHYPESYSPDSLLGRPYIKGFYECTCILKDYFITKLNINITKWNNNYWLPESDQDANKLLLDIINKHLIKLDKTDKIQEHDLIIFELRKNKRLHVGIYLGNDYFVHQPLQGLSCDQILDERWQAKVKHVYRHHSLV